MRLLLIFAHVPNLIIRHSLKDITTAKGGGFLRLTKNRIIVDGQASLGYGRYLKINKSDPNTYSNGYLDMQLWLSIGHCF
jgi:hypothetical protein